MAEIHSIARRMDAAGADRMTADLRRAFEGGTNLGPRGPQIRVLGRSLDTLAGELRTALDAIEAAFAEANVPSSGHPCTHALLAEIEHIADLARAYGDLPSLEPA